MQDVLRRSTGGRTEGYVTYPQKGSLNMKKEKDDLIEVGDVEIQPLSDEDLESVASGTDSFNASACCSTVKNACCSETGD
jgi:hypothetical protein